MPSLRAFDVGAASRGVQQQWLRRHAHWPALFERLTPAPRCLLGLLAMRSVAHGDAARALFERFEAAVSTALQAPAVEWPAGFGVFTSRHGRPLDKPDPRLPRLAPEQALLLTGPLSYLGLPSARVLARALETSFGVDASSSLGDDILGRTLVSALPTAWHEPWRRGFGLDPPQVFVSGAQAEAVRIVETVGRGDPLLEVGDPHTPQLLPRDRIALVFAATTVRVASELARSGRDSDVRAA